LPASDPESAEEEEAWEDGSDAEDDGRGRERRAPADFGIMISKLLLKGEKKKLPDNTSGAPAKDQYHQR
jgi:hypothetical protein